MIYQSVMSKNLEHEINSEQGILGLQETFEMISSIPHTLLMWDYWSPEVCDLPRVTELAQDNLSDS